MQNYKLLPSLLSILKTRNLTDSAKELNVTQSAMSKTFRQIREAFDDQIMVREGNQYILTSRGVELQNQLPELLRQIEMLFTPIKLDPAKINRRFTLAYSSFIAKSVLPIICTKIDSQAPNVSMVSRYWQEESFASFPKSNIDILLTVASDIPENLYGKQLGEDKLVVMLRNEHPLAKNPLTMDNYRKARHILVNGVIGLESHLFNNSSTHNKSFIKIFASVPSFNSAVKVLKSTNTLMTAPLHIASKYAKKYDLSLREYPISIPPHKYYLLWHAKHNQDNEHRWFRAICIDLITHDLCQRINSGVNFFNETNFIESLQ